MDGDCIHGDCFVLSKGDFMIPRMRYVSWGIANRFPGKIEMNKKLLQPKYIPLHNELLVHEMQHSDINHNWNDFKQDIHLKLNHKWLYRWFILSTPLSWINFSPLYISEGEYYFDKNLFGTWFLSIAVVIFIYYLVRSYG